MIDLRPRLRPPRFARHARAAEAARLTPIPAPDRRRQAAGRCGEDRLGPRARRCCSPAPARRSRRPPISSPCITPAGRPTERCSTARSTQQCAEPRFPLNRVIKGWGEGVQLMVVGEKRRFWIPQSSPTTACPDGPRACWCSTSSCSRSSRRRARRLPMWRRRPRTRSAPRRASPTSRSAPAKADTHPDEEQPGDRALHGLDDRRKDVRHVGRQGPADHASGWATSSRAGPKACS